MDYHKISYFRNPSFVEIFAVAKDFYVIRDISAEGFYSIILELTPNGRVNNTLFGY